MHVVYETAETYGNIVQPHLLSQKFSIQVSIFFTSKVYYFVLKNFSEYYVISAFSNIIQRDS